MTVNIWRVLAAVMFVLAAASAFGVIGASALGFAFLGVALWLMS